MDHNTSDISSKEKSVFAHFAVWFGGCFAVGFDAPTGGGFFFPCLLLLSILLETKQNWKSTRKREREQNKDCVSDIELDFRWLTSVVV